MIVFVFVFGLVSIISSCNLNSSQSEQENKNNESQKISHKLLKTENKLVGANQMKLFIGEEEVDVNWEKNATIHDIYADVQKNDLVIPMSKYSGFEQVGELGKSYIVDDKQMTTQIGDIVLYNGDNIVMFYGENSWRYTKLGEINLPQKEIIDKLSKSNLKIRLTCEWKN
ncbi:cyclophilin-like fold protein [Macrococcus animalis]|uniref:cyclophilin-like fold protein n=1 Tax=Macrococcus animalis TaxID=3395467 RepID=UPI0039BEA3AF